MRQQVSFSQGKGLSRLPFLALFCTWDTALVLLSAGKPPRYFSSSKGDAFGTTHCCKVLWCPLDLSSSTMLPF